MVLLKNLSFGKKKRFSQEEMKILLRDKKINYDEI
jgi:hypothetical protein